MISVGEAKDLILQNIQTLGEETISLSEATGRILARSVLAKNDVPSFDNSAMDGFAIRYEAHLAFYSIKYQYQAGEPQTQSLQPGEAAKIFTGAPVPQNANAIIPSELATESGGKLYLTTDKIWMGMHIRKKATQNAAQDIVAHKSNYVGPGLIALLSSCGVDQVDVYKKPRVSYIITGNELLDPGSALSDGCIFNSNGPAIQSFLQLCGIQSIHAFTATDHKMKLKETIADALDCSDLIILTGGVSAGDFDFVPQVLDELGVRKLFHKVKQKPGKPIYCGKKKHQWIFGLPGNPAAVLACLNQYVKPCILGLCGHDEIFNQFIPLPLAESWTKGPGLSHLLKAKMEHQQVKILQGQESFNLLPFNECNAFVLIDEEVEIVNKGTVLNVYPL